MDFETFKSNVEAWAEARNIYKYSTPLAQALKAVSETGELADNAVKGNIEGMKDDIGDIAVCLVNVAKMCGHDTCPSEVVNSKSMPAQMITASVAKCVSDLSFMAGSSQLSGHCPASVGAKEDISSQIKYSLGSLRLLAVECGFTFEECCAQAWSEIKDRRGRMVPGGAFVKEGA